MFWNGPEALGHKGTIVGLVRLLTEGGYRMSMAQPPPGFSSFDRDRFIRDVSSEQWMGGDADELGERIPSPQPRPNRGTNSAPQFATPR